jgi:hypothetical protein
MTEATDSESPDQKRGPGRPRKEAVQEEAHTMQTGISQEEQPSGVVHSKTRFWRGVWANKSNENDPDAVRLGINNETLTFQRGVECIVPEPYLEVAAHARYPKFKHEPGKGRKVSAYIDRFPFTRIREATFEEFKTMFAEGNRKTRAAVAQHGLQIPLEDSVPQLM